MLSRNKVRKTTPLRTSVTFLLRHESYKCVGAASSNVIRKVSKGRRMTIIFEKILIIALRLVGLALVPSTKEEDTTTLVAKHE